MGDEEEAQKILQRLQALKQQREMIISKITELDNEHTEHTLVIDTLQPLPPERRCFRMIGEVLVERTNVEVLQAVMQNRDMVRRVLALESRVARPPRVPRHALLDSPPVITRVRLPRASERTHRTCASRQLKRAMEEFAEQLKAKERELLDHIKKHNIRQTSDIPRAQGRTEEQAEQRSASGVLV